MQEKPKHGYQETPPSGYYPPPQHQPPPAINVNVQNQNIQQGGFGGQIYTKLTMMEVLGHLIIAGNCPRQGDLLRSPFPLCPLWSNSIRANPHTPAPAPPAKTARHSPA